MKNNKRTIYFFVVLLFFLSFGVVYGQETERYDYKPPAGYVPDQETAINIAVAVWTPIYGRDQIEKEKPYKAVLKDGIWYISGSLPTGAVKGGVAEAEIAKNDGRIIRITHGK